MDQQLLVFVTVVEEQSFTRAAQRLRISQPAITQHVQNLENRFDVRLFDRSNRQIRLNKAGEVVYHHAKSILDTYHTMERLVQDLNEKASGTLEIGASFTFGEYVLPHVIAAFRQAYPDIQPTISVENTSSVIRDVARGALDIGIVEGLSVPDLGVDIEAFAEDELVIVGAIDHLHADLLDRTVSPEQLESMTWIVREHGSGTREMTDYFFSTHAIHPSSMVEYGSTQIIKESVEAGLGITLLSKWAVRKELAWEILRPIAFTDQPIVRAFSFVTRKSDFQTKATRLFQAFVLGMQSQIQSHRL